MITEKELQTVNLSPTKKDFYQIWNELMELAGKLSDRWQPNSTNESDPGIVLLKLLAATADKLNYNIDKDILEAYMPSAAQIESMQKLCDMMGYNFKYYASATTPVTIYYNGNTEDFSADDVSATDPVLRLPKYTNIKTIDEDINYLTLNPASFSAQRTMQVIDCIEGTIKYCAEENNRVVTLNNLDEKNRYYFPIYNVAENGIFIYNVNDSATEWKLVNNLNIYPLKSKIYKFGYDSSKQMPYVQFPADISNIIDEGLTIAYISTNGINGNIKAKTLNKFIAPEGWTVTEQSGPNEYNETGISHSAEEFTCFNASAATNGRDIETITSAYDNYKTTIGTFDTLVTCRDYINKILELTETSNSSTPQVSNVIVTDLRDDINKSITLCSFDEFGINYVDSPIFESSSGSQDLQPLVNNFDLLIYPFKTVYGLNTKAEYVNSFKCDLSSDTTTGEVVDQSVKNIAAKLDDYKTISHKIKSPIVQKSYVENNTFKDNKSDIAAIKNYLKLTARLTTTKKVNVIEQVEIKDAIKHAIYENFNLRKLDFSEEIPFDSILAVIENADVRIKNVALEEPVLYTKFLLADNSEYDTATELPADYSKVYANKISQVDMSAEEKSEFDALTDEAKSNYLKKRDLQTKKIYNKLALRNILAGRVAMFNYDIEFTPSVTESQYVEMPSTGGAGVPIPIIYPNESSSGPINYIKPELKILNVPTEIDSTGKNKIVLKDNQIIQFRAPSFRTTDTFSAYTNYFLHLQSTDSTSAAIPATMVNLKNYLYGGIDASGFNENKDVSAEEDDRIDIPDEDDANGNVSFTNLRDFVNYIAKTSPSIIFNRDTIEEIRSFDEKEDYRAAYLRLLDASSKYGFIVRLQKESDESYKIYRDEDSENNIVALIVGDGTWDNSDSELWGTQDGGGVTTPKYWGYIPLNKDTYYAWWNWILTRPFYKANKEENVDSPSTLSGIFTSINSDQSRTIGRLIDAQKNKYVLAYSYTNQNNPLSTFFVQYTHHDFYDASSDVYAADAGGVSTPYTEDGLGRDLIATEISKNEEYELKDGEYLCINYTKAENTVDTGNTENATLITTSEVVNKYFGPGTIIRTNFDIKDSFDTKSSGTNYTKLDKYDFSNWISSNEEQKRLVPGMYSLGTDQEIEIRAIASTKIYDNSDYGRIKVYFKLNDEKADVNNEIVFLESKSSSDNGESSPSHRILEEGEYFWYLDKNETTLSYCGAGCEIFNYSNLKIAKKANDNVTVEQISKLGVDAIKNWIILTGLRYTADSDTTNNYIEWIDYDYINLAAKDTLLNVHWAGSNAANELTSTWTEGIDSAAYIFSDEPSKNPIPTLPSIKVKKAGSTDYITWQGRTKLAINVSPIIYQTLHNTSYVAGSTATADVPTCQETITCYSNYSTDDSSAGVVCKFGYYKETITPEGGVETTVEHNQDELSLKANYEISSTKDLIDLTITANLENAEGITSEEKLYEDIKIKAFKNEDFTITDGEGLKESRPLYNLSNYFTSLSLDKATSSSTTPYVKLHCAISSINEYGLLMIYYKTVNTAVSTDHSNNAYIKLRQLNAQTTTNTANSTIPAAIFNYSTNEAFTYKTPFDWWSGYADLPHTDSTRYYLKENALNIICIPESVDIELYGGTNSSDSIIFSPLSIIKGSIPVNTPNNVDGANFDFGINLALLQYNRTTNAASSDTDSEDFLKATQLLKDIKSLDIDNKFFYNTYIDLSVALDINTFADETLATPRIYYSYNNKNNKFVLSEIDANFLDSGIQFASSSTTNN